MSEVPSDPFEPLPPDPEDELVDADIGTPRRTNLVTRLLLGAVLVGVGFLVGVAVQKSLQTAAETPVLTGVVQSVQGNVVRVADNAGAIVDVTVPDTAAVTSLGLGGTLPAGAPVSVTGTRWSDGSIRATSVAAQAARR